MNDWDYLPDAAERDAAVRAIVDAALPRTPRPLASPAPAPPAPLPWAPTPPTPVPRPLAPWRLLRDFPPTLLFFGVGDCVALSLLLAALALAPLVIAANQQAPLAPLLVIFSPLLYGLLTLLTFWKEAQGRTLAWRSACRVTFRTLASLRMLLFGAVSVALVVPANLMLWGTVPAAPPLPWMLALSFSSLFVYAALSLALQRPASTASLAAPPLLWAALGAALLWWNPAAEFLLQVPVAVFVVVAAGALALYGRELTRWVALGAEVSASVLASPERRCAHAVR